MTIPAAELTQITGGQSDLAIIKTTLASLIDRSNALYDLRADSASRVACLDAKGGAQELLGLVNQYHANLSRMLTLTYGADAGPIIMGGGGGRR